ncbi:unnamed protein product [Protopolystoma xenopodis]|uniref:Uncharacterized protein n=1 Tax=Protopolystoma xenopodis TaxID=117903 RepID=A0A3S5CJF2_9PLAT|nr:unnamed protein product [Protopolystoma xenopodis]
MPSPLSLVYNFALAPDSNTQVCLGTRSKSSPLLAGLLTRKQSGFGGIGFQPFTLKARQ